MLRYISLTLVHKDYNSHRINNSLETTEKLDKFQNSKSDATENKVSACIFKYFIILYLLFTVPWVSIIYGFMDFQFDNKIMVIRFHEQNLLIQY